jgi:hypothetical protein
MLLNLPFVSTLRRILSLNRRRKEQPDLAITLLEPNSIYASHGLVILRSIADNHEIEREFKLNRPEFLSILDGPVMQVITKQLADLGYKLDHIVSYYIPGWV